MGVEEDGLNLVLKHRRRQREGMLTGGPAGTRAGECG